MIDYVADLYRAVRWDSDDEVGRVRALPGDDDDDDGDGGDGAGPS